MTLTWIIGAVALLLGGLIGWLVGGRSAAVLKAERDMQAGQARKAEVELDVVSRDRAQVELDLVQVQTERDAREQAFELRLAELREAKDALTAQFSEVSSRLLGEAQRSFLESAEQRFKRSEEASGASLKSLLQPVNDRLLRYEETVGRIENDRREAYGNLQGLMESMRVSNEAVRSEAAKLGNSLRSGPKTRGRWGEQQLRNVLETCGLSEHADFQTEVSVEGESGRLRPDVIIRVPGGHHLVVDAKMSFVAYQDAFEESDDDRRTVLLVQHAAAMKAHVTTLGAKNYWAQFEAAPDYVIMFVPGEHFLTAALEHDPALWDYAFEKSVLLATPTNLIAIARTVAAVWRQERVANDAREIALLGKELYSRLATMGGHVGKMGRNLDTAVSAYNSLVGSLESQVLTQARRFEDLNVDTGAKELELLPVIEQSTRALVKLMPIEGEHERALITENARAENG